MPSILGRAGVDPVGCGCGLLMQYTLWIFLCRCRMGASDSIQCCKSTFMVELQVFRPLVILHGE